MGIHNPSKGSFGRPSPHTSKHGKFPSPTKGIDARVSLSSNDPEVCIYCFNINPSEYGLGVRTGYREWVLGVNEGAGLGVNTIIPFEGSTEGPAEDRLFAVTNEGIWDVSTFDAPPVLKIAFPNISIEAGFGNFAHYIDGADAEFLLYADSVNGLFEYSSTLDTWTVPEDISGVDVADVNFVVVHKLRIWFGVRNSPIAWYLPVESKQGVAEAFNFGGKFQHGGSLIGLYNWTVDGGDGVDDFLIVVSGSGDILPYKGSDPTQADWSIVGTYFIGSMANGSRCVSQYGGNVSLLSTFGLTQMSDLLRGVDPRASEVDSIGAKIAPLIRRDMLTYRNESGWDIKYLQTQGIIMLTTPKRLDGQYLQYVYNVSVGGWGLWRGVPITSVDVWENSVYFGTEDGRIMVMDVDKDQVLIDPPGEINGVEIEFSMLHNYLDLDDPSLYKRGTFIRPDFLSELKPTYATKFLYDYDNSEITTIPPSDVNALAQWDISNWDEAFWTNSALKHFDKVSGGTGIGRYVSVAIKGRAISGTLLASTDVTWDTGGFL